MASTRLTSLLGPLPTRISTKFSLSRPAPLLSVHLGPYQPTTHRAICTQPSHHAHRIPINFALFESRVSTLINSFSVRHKSKRGRKSSRDEEDEEDDDDDDGLENENPLLVEDILNDGREGATRATLDVSSLRLDAFAVRAFGVPRAKIEELIYKGELFVNGEIPSKKSLDLSINDEIDVVKGEDPDNPNMVLVRRALIVKLPDKMNEQGRMKVQVDRWASLSIEKPKK